MKSPEQASWRSRATPQHLIRKERVKAAEFRRMTRANLTDEQQLARLQARGAGDCQEACILEARIQDTYFKESLTAAIEAPLPEVPVKKPRGVRKRRNKPASLM